MTSREKRFEKIIRGQATLYSFFDIRNFLEYHGFYAEKQGSSHFVFRRGDHPHITIVTHRHHVKRWYVKNAIKILREFNLIP